MFRQYTAEEQLYRDLMFAYNHYNGNAHDSFTNEKKLLLEVRESKTLAADFKVHFESLWFDQVSKWADIQYNTLVYLDRQFRDLGFKEHMAFFKWNDLVDKKI